MTRGQHGLRVKLRQLPLEQAAAGGIDPQSPEGKEWFAPQVDEAGFPGQQFPLERTSAIP